MTVAWTNDIRVNLTLPILRLGVGPFAIDPVERLVGARVVDLLEPLMTGPVSVRPCPSGPPVEVFPLRLPEGEGASIALAHLGEIGLHNEGGHLALTVPRLAATWIEGHLRDAILERRRTAAAPVATFVVAVRSGWRVAVPLGALGEIGIEAC